jgi:hypothetical protein|tara:strand:- start:89 stop:1522 length:1434 start_codon:yes stop_codon:yes gene_type:complete
MEKEELDAELEELFIDSKETKVARMSGKLHNNLLYWTVFLKKGSEYLPYVITEKAEILKVKEEENVFYFEYDFITYKYNIKLFWNDSYRIRTVSKNILLILKNPPNKKELFDKIKDTLYRYYDHSNAWEHNLLVPFVIVPYICWGLGRTYYLILQGKEDTGKSTLQELFAYLQMNGWFGGKSSVPVMIRLKHLFGISANQDEFEKMHEQEKKNYLGVLNSGYTVNGTYNFVNMNKKNIEDQIQICNSFGTNSFSVNSLNLNWDFDKSFLSRCYKVIATRKNRKTFDIHNLMDEDIESFQKLRDEIFIYCLLNYSSIEDDIHKIREELEKENIFGRSTDIYSIILGVLFHFKGEYKNEKEELLSREGLDKTEELETIDSVVFTYLVHLFNQEKPQILVTNKEITNFVNDEIDMPEGKRISPKSIGATLRKYNLLQREDQVTRIGKGYNYLIHFAHLKDALERFGFKSQLKIIEGGVTK